MFLSDWVLKNFSEYLSVPNIQYPIPNTQYPILFHQTGYWRLLVICTIPNTQYPTPNPTQHSIPNTQYSILFCLIYWLSKMMVTYPIPKITNVLLYLFYSQKCQPNGTFGRSKIFGYWVLGIGTLGIALIPSRPQSTSYYHILISSKPFEGPWGDNLNVWYLNVWKNRRKL